MQLLRFHLIEDESCEKEIKRELEGRNWTRWSCVTCMENLKLHRQRKNGNGREKSIWTRSAGEVSDGNSSLMIRTGAWHAPVDSRHGDALQVVIGKGKSCNERRKIRL